MNASAPTPDLVGCVAFADFWCRVTHAPHITLAAITPDGSTTTRTFARGAWDELRGFVAWVQAHGRNVHFQPNETPPGCDSKPSKSVMVAALCRHADVDPDDKHFPLAEERERLSSLAADLVTDPDMSPTVILDSGNGIQALWVVAREPLDAATLDRVECENREVEAAFGAKGTHNIDRLLRMPGTVNFPNRHKRELGRVPAPSRVRFESGRRYAPEDAARLGLHLAARLAGKGLVRDGGPKPAGERGGARQEVSDRLHDLLRRGGLLAARWQGDTSGMEDGSRSALALSLCGLLRRAGFGREDTLQLLRTNPAVGGWVTEKGDAAGGRGLDRLWEKSSREPAPEGTHPWPPLRLDLAAADLLPSPPLPLDIFPPSWREWIARAAEGAGAPPDYVACALLAVAGAVIGNARWGSPWEGWKHPPVVWVACVGLPSAGKSPAIDAVVGPLADLARELNEDFEERLRAWRTAAQEAKERRAAWEAEVKRAVKSGTAPPLEPLGAAEPEKARKHRVHSTDATVEAARDRSATNPRGMLLHRDELAGWIGSMDRYGGGKGGADRSFWLQAYDGGPWMSDRVKDGDDACDVPHLTWGIVGGIQPDRLASMLLAGDDDGLSARFVYTWPAPPADVSNPPGGGGLPLPLKDALRRLRELSLPENGEPVVLPFTPAAVEALQDWRRAVKAMEADAAGLFLSWLGKLPGMAVRLAVVFLHLDWLARPAGTPPPEAVDLDGAARAIGFLEEYAVPMARRAFGEAALPEAERDARRLARWLVRRRPVPRTLNARELRRMADGPGIPTRERIEAALAELAEMGVVRLAPGRPDGGPGRPRREWDVNPELWGDRL